MGKVDSTQIEIKRHSLSHILAMAVLDMFPKAKLAIGPSIENGFYYDFDLPRTLVPEDLPLLEAKMREIIKEDLKFEPSKKKTDEAMEFEKKRGQLYKAELLFDLAKAGEKHVNYYTTGDFVELCAGPHVANTKELESVGFKLTSIAGAYWKGSEKNKMLQRVYALAFETQKELDEYEAMMLEAEKRDHRKLGASLDLFFFPRGRPRVCFLASKGNDSSK